MCLSVKRFWVADSIHLHDLVAQGRRHIGVDGAADAAADGPAVEEEGGVV